MEYFYQEIYFSITLKDGNSLGHRPRLVWHIHRAIDTITDSDSDSDSAIDMYNPVPLH